MSPLKARIEVKKNSNWPTSASEVLVVFTYRQNGTLQLPGKTPASIKNCVEALPNFKGKFSEIQHLGGPGTTIENVSTGAHLLIVGLGESKDLHAQNLLVLGARLGQELRKYKVAGATVNIDSLIALGAKAKGASGPKDFASRKFSTTASSSDDILKLLAEGIHLGLYRFDLYRSSKDEEKNTLFEVQLVGEKILPSAKTNALLNEAATLSRAVYLTRDLQTTPGGDLRPTQLAKKAVDLAKELKIKATIWDDKKLRQEGLNGIVSVGQGSDDPPCLIVLDYQPKNTKAPTLVLVGKGITFDTGGISLKPGAGMEEMKYDMSGAASVLGAMQAIAELKAPVRVVAVIAAAENMPSGTAIRPGDIYRAYNGKTVEVLNTDAEGRLVLADALHFAKQYNPDAVVDVATLTGAVIIALGGVASAVMGNDGNLIDAFKTASAQVGERAWELPLYGEYGEDMKSKIADIKNIGGRRDGGSQKGGAFLNYFVEDAYPWIHVDIAGSSMQPQDQGAHCPTGAGSGVPTRSLVELSRNFARYFQKPLLEVKKPSVDKKSGTSKATKARVKSKATRKRA